MANFATTRPLTRPAVLLMLGLPYCHIAVYGTSCIGAHPWVFTIASNNSSACCC
jgi:hypothetical protein